MFFQRFLAQKICGMFLNCLTKIVLQTFEQTALCSAIYVYIWISWYDLKAGKSQLQRAWHNVINLNSEVEDLYFKDSQTYGNPYSVLKYGFTFAIPFVSFAVTLYLYKFEVFWLSVEAVYVLIMLLEMCIFYHVNSHSKVPGQKLAIGFII